MHTERIVKRWFQAWELGDYLDLPITEEFKHTSPYGVIEGNQVYLDLVEANKDKFLNHRFVIHDIICQDNVASVRYTAIQEDFQLEVSEWHWIEGDLIKEIVAYYNIPGEVREDRKLEGLEE